MREVINDFEADVNLVLFDVYGRKIGEFLLKSLEKKELPLFNKEQFLRDKTSKEFFVYSGKGCIKLSKCQKKYDFSKIRIDELDFYLQNKKFLPQTKSQAREQILDFLSVCEKNLAKGFLFLNPPRFEELESDLIFGKKFERFW